MPWRSQCALAERKLAPAAPNSAAALTPVTENIRKRRPPHPASIAPAVGLFREVEYFQLSMSVYSCDRILNALKDCQRKHPRDAQVRGGQGSENHTRLQQDGLWRLS